MKIIPIPLNSDNYGYLVINNRGNNNNALLIDISNQPEIVSQRIQEMNLNLKLILTTHKHWDHAGGNNTMKLLYPGLLSLSCSLFSYYSENQFIFFRC